MYKSMYGLPENALLPLTRTVIYLATRMFLGHSILNRNTPHNRPSRAEVHNLLGHCVILVRSRAEDQKL